MADFKGLLPYPYTPANAQMVMGPGSKEKEITSGTDYDALMALPYSLDKAKEDDANEMGGNEERIELLWVRDKLRRILKDIDETLESIPNSQG